MYLLTSSSPTHSLSHCPDLVFWSYQARLEYVNSLHLKLSILYKTLKTRKYKLPELTNTTLISDVRGSPTAYHWWGRIGWAMERIYLCNVLLLWEMINWLPVAFQDKYLPLLVCSVGTRLFTSCGKSRTIVISLWFTSSLLSIFSCISVCSKLWSSIWKPYLKKKREKKRTTWTATACFSLVMHFRFLSTLFGRKEIVVITVNLLYLPPLCSSSSTRTSRLLRLWFSAIDDCKFFKTTSSCTWWKTELLMNTI